MTTVAQKPAAFTDYHVADIALAPWGRREIAIAETEMPGLMVSSVILGADRGAARPGRRAHSHRVIRLTQPTNQFGSPRNRSWWRCAL